MSLDSAIDELYATQNTTINNLQTSLNNYDSITLTLAGVSRSSAYIGPSRLYINEFANQYKYFKILSVTNNGNTNNCYTRSYAYNKSNEGWKDLTVNQRYEVYSDTDNYKYGAIMVRVESDNGVEGICYARIKFYNNPNE